MKHRIILLAIAALAAFEAAAARPRLVVNIVVGSMRAEDLGRYAGNYGEGGLRRLLDGGTVFADSRYDYQQTTTPVSLATLTTGAMPSTHGVIGARWRDYVENDAVELIAGRKGPGPYNLIAPTLAEALLQHEPGAKAVSVATEAMSAVIMAGHGGEAFWLDSARCGWETSPYYAPEVPEWVARSNRERYNLSYITPEWRTLYEKGRYLNTRNWDIVLTGKSRKDKDRAGGRAPETHVGLRQTCSTPRRATPPCWGFAKQAIAQFKLGDDATPDLLNICLDTPRRISEAYGPESVEVEDMYYRLDRDLADFLTFVFAQVRNGEVLVVLHLRPRHQPFFRHGARREPTGSTPRQFEVIVNGFLNVRYGMGDWVLEYEDKCVYLNHNLIYERELEPRRGAERGGHLRHAVPGRVPRPGSPTAMRTSYFGSGYARKMQNSFYPRRSGDVILNLMPGWIEEQERCWSIVGVDVRLRHTRCRWSSTATASGTQRVNRRVDMTAVAPTAGASGWSITRAGGIGRRSTAGNNRFVRI